MITVGNPFLPLKTHDYDAKSFFQPLSINEHLFTSCIW